MNILFHEKKSVVWYFGLCIYVGMILFLIISLISYHPTDSSWFYVSNETRDILNQAGFWGANLAATLYYLFGGAAFIMLVPLACLGLMVITGGNMKTDGERLIASIMLIVIGAIFLTVYHVDYAWSPHPGGIIGLLGSQKLLYYFDPIGRILFLYMALCASLILLFRWSFMFLVQGVMHTVVVTCTTMKKYQVISKMCRFMIMCLRIIFIRVPVSCARFVQSLIDGRAFEETDLLYPEEETTLCDDEIFTGIRKSEKYNYPIIRLYSHDMLKKMRFVKSLSFSARPDASSGSAVNTSPELPSARPELVEGFPRALEETLQQVQGERREENTIKNLRNKSESINYVILTLPKNSKQSINSLDAHHAFISDERVSLEKAKSVLQKISRYTLPRTDIFVAEKYANDGIHVESELQERATVLQDKLKRFGVNGHVTAIKRGPVVTLFEYQPDVDTKISKIIALEDDLAMALQAMSIRIIAPIPGRSVVGFEVSNTTRHDVLFSHIINQSAFTQFSGSLPLVLGKGTIGDVVVVDLARMPHLLIAGSTGSGKSVALNAILISLLCKLNPDELKLILIDPKRLEFAAFTDIAHLLFPIVTNAHQAAPVLRWVVQEMEDRYEKMAQFGARNIDDYNLRIKQNRNSVDTQIDLSEKKLSYIVVVIDELADLMITAGRDIEDLITRITQMARAAGIHMIVATQRPSVDVITGLIKANFPSRISFRVASRIDSRTILDTIGADRLLGRGDMLFMDAATSQLRRVHGAYVSDKEIEQVADHIRAQRKVEYLDLHQVTTQQGDMLGSDDVLYKDVRQFLDEIDEISISLLQRKFRIGYNRSARIIDLLESQGLIMPQDGSKTRKVIR